MTILNAPNSTATIDVPEGRVEQYEKAGWTQVDKPKRQAKKADEKPAEK